MNYLAFLLSFHISCFFAALKLVQEACYSNHLVIVISLLQLSACYSYQLVYGHGVNVKHELGDDISTKLLHHVFRLQFCVSLLRALASDASVRSLRVAVARSEVGDGASRLQTVWRRRRACAMRHFLWSKLCEYALLSDYSGHEEVPAGAWHRKAGAWQQRARYMRVNGPEALRVHLIGDKHGKNLRC